jgi:hypothetical protein
MRIPGFPSRVKADTQAVLKGALRSLCWLCNGGCDRLLVRCTEPHACGGNGSCGSAVAAPQRPLWRIAVFASDTIWNWGRRLQLNIINA